MELRQLTYFITLCEELHFTKAAERLHIAQPTLSQQIKVLENELGVPLFDRLGKKIAITAAGHILYEQCAHIFQALDNATEQIAELKEIKGGAITIGALPGELTDLVSKRLVDYYRRYPNVKLRVESNDDWQQQLYNNAVDFAIAYRNEALAYNEAQIQLLPLFIEDLVFVAHRDHPLMHIETLQLRDVLQTALVLFPVTHQCRTVIDNAAHANHLSVTPHIETASVPAIFQLASHNVTATIVSTTLYELHKTPLLNARRIGNLQRELVLLYRKDKFMSFAARAFMQMLRAPKHQQ